MEQTPIDREYLTKYLKGKMSTCLLYLSECPLADVDAARGQLVMLKRICVDNDISVRLEMHSDQFYQAVRKELDREFRCGLCYNQKIIRLPSNVVIHPTPERPNPIPVIACPECSR